MFPLILNMVHFWLQSRSGKKASLKMYCQKQKHKHFKVEDKLHKSYERNVAKKVRTNCEMECQIY